MNFEGGFPIPLHGNGDSLGSTTPLDKGTGNSLTMMTTTRPIPMGNTESWNATPERNGIAHDGWTLQDNGIGTRLIPERSNTVVEKQGNENWEDLIGMYTDLLQEETLDLNGIIEDLNLTPPPPNRNQKWVDLNLNTKPSCSPYSSMGNPVSWNGNRLANGAQDSSLGVQAESNGSSVLLANGAPNDNIRVSSNYMRTASASSTIGSQQTQTFTANNQIDKGPLVGSNYMRSSSASSMFGNQQTQTLASNNVINDGFPIPYRPCYNLNSPPRSEPDADSSTVIGSFPFAPFTPDNQRKQTDIQWVPENIKFPVLEALTPAKNGHENQTVSLEDAENLYNELLQTIGDSPSSAISTTQKEHVSEDIDLNKTPAQKTPARKKKHRPSVIKEGKPKRTPKPKDPQNETRVKRKYVRKKGVNTPEKQHEKGVSKRKYVRKNGIENFESQHKSNVDDVVETPDKSCKKRLNFDSECVAQDEEIRGEQQAQAQAQAQGVSFNVDFRDIKQERRVNGILETSAMRNTQQNEYTAGTMQAGNQHISGHALNLLARNLSMRKYVAGQHIREEGIRNIVIEPNSQGLDERRGIKRQSSEQMYRHNVNAIDSLRLYQKMLLGVENRTDNSNNLSLENHKKTKIQSVFQPRVSCEPSYIGHLGDNSRQMSGIYRNGLAMQLLNSCQFRTPMAAPHKHQVPSGMQLRTIRCAQDHEIGSVTGRFGWNPAPPTPPKEAYRSAVTTYPATLLEKKQSAKPDLYNRRLNGVDQMLQQHRNNPMEGNQQSSLITKGHTRKQKVEVSVDDITYKLEGLCICAENEKGRKALVLYEGSKAMIPFEPKKRNQRAKVDLDPETDRLWRLLMGKEGSEGAETMDKDKEKWWENERRVFRGRADSFIARMHLVQGDRRFSRWKGSVVDSVIGVFLTQNVSDHLSSSAFMSLASKFPLKSTTSNETRYQDRTHVIVEEPIEVVKPNDIIKGQPVSQDSFDSSTIQTVDESRSSSGSNSEAEDQTNGFETSKQSNAPVNLIHAEKPGVFKESFGHDYWSRLLDEQTKNMHHLSKDQDFSMRIPRMNGANNLNSSSRFPPPNLMQESLASSGARTSPLPSSNSGMTENGTHKQITISFEANSKEHKYNSTEPSSVVAMKILKERNKAAEDEKNRGIDWDSLRKQVFLKDEKRERSKDANDSLDYEALRHAHVNEISDAIKERGMNNLLADRIKDFLNRLVRDHGSIDLEWLRDAPPDKAKEYLLSFRGLGLKSVECVRLLTLHHLAFPVDTNVGRIAVRLGWVPLQPLPESLQLHLLEMYPVLESIQKYLWPRLCKLDQLTLYELHYQMITFGKVFCTKSKPNCNACPMRAECRHFASAFASARLALPGPEEKRIVTSDAPPVATNPTPPVVIRPMALPQAENDYYKSVGSFGQNCEPIIEEPTTPEPEIAELSISDIEDQYYDDSDEIPSIKLNMEEFTTNLQNIMEDGMELQDNMSKALVALNPNAGSIPTPKLKNVSRLRTEHQVYELPDSHQLLEGLDKREPDDPSPYLLAIWTPGETANSIQPPERGCSARESGKLCDQATCFSCNSIKEANSQVVRGTILIPCRTAMRGSFPLNGTYFQVNEMFADHASSLNPIDVPRSWIWNLPRRIVYFGTSVSTIFKGLTTEGIQYCFWRGFVCVRGFDQKTRAPRPLMARLHFPASKLKTKNEDK